MGRKMDAQTAMQSVEERMRQTSGMIEERASNSKLKGAGEIRISYAVTTDEAPPTNDE
jgi:hypothetical protein